MVLSSTSMVLPLATLLCTLVLFPTTFAQNYDADVEVTPSPLHLYPFPPHHHTAGARGHHGVRAELGPVQLQPA